MLFILERNVDSFEGILLRTGDFDYRCGRSVDVFYFWEHLLLPAEFLVYLNKHLVDLLKLFV